MIPADIKKIVEKYCMGLEPTEVQENEIMDAVKAAGLDANSRREVVSYMAELMAGPTREQIAAEAARKKAAEEAENRAREVEKKAKEAEAARKRAEKERALAAEKERISKLTPSKKFDEGKQLINGKDYDKGIDLIKMASQEGLAEASKYLAFGFEEGMNNIKKHDGQSLPFFLAFFKQSDQADIDLPRAYYKVGMIYQHFYDEYNLSKDIRKAIQYYEKAAELGCVDALSKLAFGYDYGKTGFPKDENKSVQYYLAFVSKADKTHPNYTEALYNLGQFYYLGTHGVDIDKEAGKSYYRKAFLRGHKDAGIRLIHIDEEEKAIANKELNRIKQIIIFIVASIAYLFFTIKATAILHTFWVFVSSPFWVLLLGVIYTFFCLVWGGNYEDYMRKKRNPFWLVALIPASITCLYFIVRSWELEHPFWMWFWMVTYIVLVAVEVFFYFLDKNKT